MQIGLRLARPADQDMIDGMTTDDDATGRR
jgi:hypothetical protein